MHRNSVHASKFVGACSLHESLGSSQLLPLAAQFSLIGSYSSEIVCNHWVLYWQEKIYSQGTSQSLSLHLFWQQATNLLGQMQRTTTATILCKREEHFCRGKKCATFLQSENVPRHQIWMSVWKKIKKINARQWPYCIDEKLFPSSIGSSLFVYQSGARPLNSVTRETASTTC